MLDHICARWFDASAACHRVIWGARLGARWRRTQGAEAQIKLRVGRSLAVGNVKRVAKPLICTHGRATGIGSDNGPALVAATGQRWLYDTDAQARYIDPAARGKIAMAKPATRSCALPASVDGGSAP